MALQTEYGSCCSYGEFSSAPQPVEAARGSRNSSGVKSFLSCPANDMSFEELQSMLGSITRAAQGARGSQDGARLDDWGRRSFCRGVAV